MADVGSASEPRELIRKRITAQIKRLEFSIESQELEKLEALQRAKTIDDNIKASKEALKDELKNLEVHDNAEEGSET